MPVDMATPVARRAAAAQCRTRCCSLDSREHGLHAPAMFDPRSTEYLGDPYAQLADLRAQGPSHVDPASGRCFLLTFDVVEADCHRSCVASEGGPGSTSRGTRSPPTDPAMPDRGGSSSRR